LGAPVSGESMTAEKGTLTIVVSDDSEVLEKHCDIFQTVRKTIFHVGGVGLGVRETCAFEQSITAVSCAWRRSALGDSSCPQNAAFGRA